MTRAKDLTLFLALLAVSVVALVAVVGNIGNEQPTAVDAAPAVPEATGTTASPLPSGRQPSLSLDKAAYAWTQGELTGKDGVVAEVLNETSEDVGFEVRLTLSDLEAVKGTPELATADVVGLAQPPGSEPADDRSTIVASGRAPKGGSEPLRFDAAGLTAKLKTGTYNGRLTVFGSDDRRVVRAPVTLTVAGDEGTVSAVPAAAKQTMQAVRWTPFGDRRVTVRGAWIPLAGTVDRAVKPSELTLTPGASLGALSGDEGGVAGVRFAGATKDLPAASRESRSTSTASTARGPTAGRSTSSPPTPMPAT